MQPQQHDPYTHQQPAGYGYQQPQDYGQPVAPYGTQPVPYSQPPQPVPYASAPPAPYYSQPPAPYYGQAPQAQPYGAQAVQYAPPPPIIIQNAVNVGGQPRGHGFLFHVSMFFITAGLWLFIGPVLAWRRRGRSGANNIVTFR